MEAERAHKWTVSEYLAQERNSLDKHEFLDGEISAMAGGKPRHNLISANVIGLLHAKLRQKPCLVMSTDQRIYNVSTKLYTYADATVVCGGMKLHSQATDTLINPTIIIEVLSPSTEAYDRGAKFAHYRRLDSLREYILISQHEPLIEHYLRQNDTWVLRTWTEGEVALPSCDVTLNVTDIYDKVSEIPAEPPLPIPERDKEKFGL